MTHIKYLSNVYSEEFTLILFNVFIGKLDFSRCHFGPFWVRMPYFRFGHSHNRKKAVARLVDIEINCGDAAHWIVRQCGNR